jgi:hypothetical protein
MSVNCSSSNSEIRVRILLLVDCVGYFLCLVLCLFVGERNKPYICAGTLSSQYINLCRLWVWHWWICQQYLWQGNWTMYVPTKDQWTDMQGAITDTLLPYSVSVPIWSWGWTYPCQHSTTIRVWCKCIQRIFVEGLCSIFPTSGNQNSSSLPFHLS